MKQKYSYVRQIWWIVKFTIFRHFRRKTHLTLRRVEKQIKSEVADLVCKQYNLTADEVKSVTFKEDGEIEVTITPNEFVKIKFIKEDN